jgi:hypothetical protein
MLAVSIVAACSCEMKRIGAVIRRAFVSSNSHAPNAVHTTLPGELAA